jgi:hypothetical protein
MSGRIGLSLAKYIGTLGIAGVNYSETSDSTLVMNDMPSRPDHCITVVDTGGYEGDSKLPYDPTHVQLIFRSDQNPTWAYDTWDAVYAKMHGLRNVVLDDGTLIVWCLARQANPVSIGTDDNDRHMFTMNLWIEVLNPTEARPIDA